MRFQESHYAIEQNFRRWVCDVTCVEKKLGHAMFKFTDTQRLVVICWGYSKLYYLKSIITEHSSLNTQDHN